MNYDHLERAILGYGDLISHRTERRRMFQAGLSAAPGLRSGNAVRLQVADALRSLANHLDSRRPVPSA